MRRYSVSLVAAGKKCEIAMLSLYIPETRKHCMPGNTSVGIDVEFSRHIYIPCYSTHCFNQSNKNTTFNQ